MTKIKSLTGAERCEMTTPSGRRCVQVKDHRNDHKVDLGYGKLVRVF